jgi:hypothetical protein
MASIRINPKAKNNLAPDVVAEIMTTLKGKVEQMPDPEHEGQGHHASITAAPDTGWEIKGDCDAIVAAARDELIDEGLIEPIPHPPD